MEKDIGYKLLKLIYLCFIDIQFCYQIQIFGFDNPYQERPGAMPPDKRGGIIAKGVSKTPCLKKLPLP